jgi:hypothetical protein
MTVSFYFYSRIPLGRHLPRIYAACESTSLLKPRAVLLTSRQRRPDLPLDSVFASAGKSASDSCELAVERGDIGMSWVYGKRRHIPRVWGTLKVAEGELDDLVHALDLLAASAGTTYGTCDLKAIRDQAMRTAPDWCESGGVVAALRTLYWYNYFGDELAQHAPLDGSVGAKPGLVRLPGGIRWLTRTSPSVPIDAENLRVLAGAWPVFTEFDEAARFRNPVKIDYAEVWSGPDPVVGPRPVRDIVGQPAQFIDQAKALADKFHDWAKARGQRIESEDDLRRIFRQHEAVIRDEVLVPAIAAYGELIRRGMDGVWGQAQILHRGEPIVSKRGRPWIRRRVVREALEALSPVEL